MNHIVLATMLAATLWASSTLARDIFIDNVSGDDRHDGRAAVASGATVGPCRTIRRGLELAGPGDRVVIKATGVPYRESITLQAARHSGLANRPFRLIGNGAVLEGSRPVPQDGWEHVEGDLYRFQPARMSHQILYLDGKPARRRIAGEGQPLPQLEPLEWCLFEGSIYFRTEHRRLPRQYELSHTSLPAGITIYEARHVVVSDLIVQGFQLDGVNAHDGVMQASLVGLICRGNGRSGISIGGASRVKIVGCLVGDNGAAQVRTEGYCKAEIINCRLLDNTAPGLVREGGEVTTTGDGE